MSVRDRAAVEIIPPRYAMQEASNMCRPLEVTHEALQTFFHALDDDRDEQITVRDMQLFRERNKLNMSPEVVNDMFKECKQRRFYNGQDAHKISLEDVTAAVSFRKLQNKSWQTRPFREQWIYMIKTVWTSETIFAPRPAVMNVVPALSAKETGRQYPVSSSSNLFGKSTWASISPIRSGSRSHAAGNSLHTKAGGQFAATPANLSESINRSLSGDLITDSIDHQLANSLIGDRCDVDRPHTAAPAGEYFAGRDSYRPATSPATVGFDVQRQYRDFNHSLNRDSELLERGVQAGRNSEARLEQGYYRNHLAKSLTGVRPGTSSLGSGNGRPVYKTFFDKATTNRFDIEGRQHKIAKIDVKPGMACADTSVHERRLLQEKKSFEAQTKRLKKKPYKSIGFNQMPDNTAVKVQMARYQKGLLGDSEYKTSIVPVPRNFRDFDNPEESGRTDFQGFFDRSWQSESWKKDVMIRGKTSKIANGGGKDFVFTGGCMDQSKDADLRGVDRHVSRSDWGAKW